MKAPAFQFYTGDWMKDPALRACSPAARGLWIDCLCLMFESPRRGYLQHGNGSAVTEQQLARMTGCTLTEVRRHLRELEAVEVFSRTEGGVIFSRRMVRDEEHRQTLVENGRQGGRPGRPAHQEANQKGNQIGNQDPNQGDNQDGNQTPNQTPNQTGNLEGNPNGGSSSSSSPSGREDKQSPPPPAGGSEGPGTPAPSPRRFDPLALPLPFPSPAFRTAWSQWVEYRRRRRPALAPDSAARQLAALGALPEPAAIECIETSIRNSWQGLFPEKFAGRSPPARSRGEAEARFALDLIRDALDSED